MSSLWKAMLEAQKKIKHAVKDAKNPHFKNDYATLQATLDAVKPTLNECGLVLTQEIRHGNSEPGCVRVTTRIVHAASGEQTQDAQVIPLAKNDPQGHGSAVTYARRYAIQAMLAIASEDDDGNEASNVKPVPVQKFDKPATPADPKEVAKVQDKLTKSLGWQPLK
jgi:hypothetical protein